MRKYTWILMVLASLVLVGCASKEDVRTIVKEEIANLPTAPAPQVNVDSQAFADALAALPTPAVPLSATEIVAAMPKPEPVDEAAIAAAAADAVLSEMLPQLNVLSDTIASLAVQPPQLIAPWVMSSTPTMSGTVPMSLTASMIFTQSLPNFCAVVDTTQEDIDGRILEHNGTLFQNAAIGLVDCVTVHEGRWYEGYPPSEDHNVTPFSSSGENTSNIEGTQWILPAGAELRVFVFNLALGKCQNWLAAGVEPEPLVFNYINLDTLQLVHQNSTCDAIADWEIEVENNVVKLVSFTPLENPLPDEIGAVPHWMLPHFTLGYTWGGVPISGTVSAGTSTSTSGTFTGISSFTTENGGMSCRPDQNPLLGDNVVTLDPSWDPQCIYLVDASKSQGGIQGKPAIGLVRGEELAAAAATFDASVWAVPAGWVATKWASQFAGDNCPATLPTLIYEDGAWVEYEVHVCP